MEGGGGGGGVLVGCVCVCVGGGGLASLYLLKIQPWIQTSMSSVVADGVTYLFGVDKKGRGGVGYFPWTCA